MLQACARGVVWVVALWLSANVLVVLAQPVLTVKSKPAVASVPAVLSDSQRLAAILQPIHQMSADFTQVVRDLHGNVLQQSSGYMAWQRPHRFYWQIKSPEPQLIVTDGQWLWIYNPGLAQVTKRSMQTGVSTPAALLSGSVDQLKQKFTVKLQHHVGKQPMVFQLTPRNSQSPFQHIQLIVVAGQVRSMQFSDQLHQQTLFTFSKARVNQPLDPGLFDFHPPVSIEVVTEPAASTMH